MPHTEELILPFSFASRFRFTSHEVFCCRSRPTSLTFQHKIFIRRHTTVLTTASRPYRLGVSGRWNLLFASEVGGTNIEIGVLAMAWGALPASRAVLRPYGTPVSNHQLTQPPPLNVVRLMCSEDWPIHEAKAPLSERRNAHQEF